MQLSKNFKLAEFSRSETAARKGIDNTIPAVCVGNIKVLVEQVLQPLRDHFRQAIRVTSGYRCPALNRAVGGAATSQHLTGEAADIVAPLSFPPSGSGSYAAGVAAPGTLPKSLASDLPQGGKVELLRWFVWMMDNLEFDQLILERSSPLGGKEGALWIHVSYRVGRNRQQVLLAA